jgi:hypothetical protein
MNAVTMNLVGNCAEQMPGAIAARDNTLALRKADVPALPIAAFVKHLREWQARSDFRSDAQGSAAESVEETDAGSWFAILTAAVSGRRAHCYLCFGDYPRRCIPLRGDRLA